MNKHSKGLIRGALKVRGLSVLPIEASPPYLDGCNVALISWLDLAGHCDQNQGDQSDHE
jgi:hypothetical protein